MFVGCEKSCFDVPTTKVGIFIVRKKLLQLGCAIKPVKNPCALKKMRIYYMFKWGQRQFQRGITHPHTPTHG